MVTIQVIVDGCYTSDCRWLLYKELLMVTMQQVMVKVGMQCVMVAINKDLVKLHLHEHTKS